MIVAQISEFLMHAKDYLNRVEEGESVQILRDSKSIALLIPAATSPVSRWKTAPTRIQLKGDSLRNAVIAERRSSRF